MEILDTDTVVTEDTETLDAEDIDLLDFGTSEDNVLQDNDSDHQEVDLVTGNIIIHLSNCIVITTVI